jgi:hypothetical protein
MTTKLLFLVGIIPLLLVPLANAQHSTFAATLYNCHGINNPDPTNLLPNSSSVQVDKPSFSAQIRQGILEIPVQK